jgi:hypothetical protein
MIGWKSGLFSVERLLKIILIRISGRLNFSFSSMTDKIIKLVCLFRSYKDNIVFSLESQNFSFSLRSYIINGPVFIRLCDIPNRDQLIVTTKSSYEREVVKCDGSNTQISAENITGKCSILSLKHYCTCKLFALVFLF